jgi:hypothetical protein
MALVNGMGDFSAARVDSAYKEWDEQFSEREKVGEKLDRIYGKISAIKPDVVEDTIFSRSPLFYSLVLVLDSLARMPSDAALEDALVTIDARFNDSRPTAERPEEDLTFVAACTASTQRIRSRETRFNYIKSFI